MRADRLLRLLMLLQRHKRATAAQLAGELEVSVRTVLRDMDALSAAGVPVYTERGRAGGCVLLDGYRTDASGLTPAEAQALFAWSGRESAATDLGLHHDLSGALAKVAASTPAGALQHAESLGELIVSDRRGWFGSGDNLDQLPALRAAVADHRRVRIIYAGGRDLGPRTRTLDPIGLVDQAGRWYLVAEHRGQARTYRVSRVRRVTVLPVAAEPVDQRAVAEVWRDLKSAFEQRADPLTIEVAVEPDYARSVRGALNTQLVPGSGFETLPPDGDGRLRWRLTVVARQLAIGVAIGLSDGMQVIYPAELIAEIREAADRCRQLYPA